MIVAIIGSRNLGVIGLENFLPENVTGLVSGGAKGVDTCARKYAQAHNIPLTEFLPDYTRYGRSAPLKRNLEIIAYADLVLAFWDGKSRGTKYVIDNCKKRAFQSECIFISLKNKRAAISGSSMEQIVNGLILCYLPNSHKVIK